MRRTPFYRSLLFRLRIDANSGKNVWRWAPNWPMIGALADIAFALTFWSAAVYIAVHLIRKYW